MALEDSENEKKFSIPYQKPIISADSLSAPVQTLNTISTIDSSMSAPSQKISIQQLAQDVEAISKVKHKRRKRT